MIKSLFRKADFIIIILFAAVTTASFLFLKTHSKHQARLLVTSQKKEYVYPLDKDRILEVQGALGISTIIIKEGRAYFQESPCHNKVCVHMGSVSEENDWAACLPNDIFIRVE
ncbi:MAG: NusG domain II-containing protein [Treponema sp.]|nr:NusG domain II-containing protein [Treponema sp.]